MSRRPAPHVGRSVRSALALVVLLLAAPRPGRAGMIFVSGDDSDDSGHCQESRCDKMIGNVLSDLYDTCAPLPASDRIVAVGTNTSLARAALVGNGFSLKGWIDASNGGPGASVPVDHCNAVTCIDTVDFTQYRILYVASSAPETGNGLTQSQLDALVRRKADIADWFNTKNGRILALTEAELRNPFGWLPRALTFMDVDTSRAEPLPALKTVFPSTNVGPRALDHCCYHNGFTGPKGYSGLTVVGDLPDVLIQDPEDPTRRIPAPVLLGGACGTTLGTCGDGVLDPGEDCDDGNTRNGDGCPADCKFDPPTCTVTAPPRAECAPGGTDVPLAAKAADNDEDPLTYAWTTTCPGAAFDDAARLTPVLRLAGPPPCPVRCSATLVVSDGRFKTTCSVPVEMDDTRPPAVTALLAPRPAVPPRSPASPRAPGSPTSAPSVGDFQVLCSAADCDPGVVPEASFVVVSHRVEPGHACAADVEEVPVPCGETVRIQLVAPPCPDRPPRNPRPAKSVGSDGVLQVTGERVVLHVRASDACGNASEATFDPAKEPAASPLLVPPPEPRCRVEPCRRAPVAVSVSVLATDCSSVFGLPADTFSVRVNGLAIGSVPGLSACTCARDLAEVRSTDPGVLGSLGPRSTVAVTSLGTGRGLALGEVRVRVDLSDGAHEDFCVFDGSARNPAPACADRDLCAPPALTFGPFGTIVGTFDVVWP